MKKTFILLAILFSVKSLTQNKEVETIEKLLSKTSEAVKENKLDSANYYSNQALKKADAIGNLKYQAKSKMAIAQISFSIGNKKQAYEKANDVLKIAKKINDQELIIDASLQIANVHFYNMDDEKAMQLYKNIEKIAEKNKILNKTVVKTLSNIGLLFFRATNNSATNLKNAENYFKKSIDASIKIKDKEEEHISLCFLGGVYNATGEFDKAIEIDLQAYNFFKKTNNFNRIPHALYGLGEAYIGKGDFKSAEKYYKEFVQLNEDMNNNNGLAKSHWALAQLYNASKQFDKAAEEYEKSIHFFKNDETIELGALSAVYNELSDTYYKSGNYKKAYDFLGEYITVEDSIKRSESEIAISELETKYQANKKEQELKLLSEKSKLQNIIYLSLLGLLVALGGFLFYGYRNKIKTAEKLRELNDLKSRFFANISHEFRTPLTLIKSPLQSLQNEIKDQNQKTKLHLIDKNSNRMLDLVDQLLELSKIDSGKLQLLLKEGNIGTFLTSIVEPFEYQAKERELKFDSTIAKTNENHYFDKDVIEKIVTNLLSNALKYTPENQTIKFSSFIENKQLKLIVSNSGSEIKKDDLPKLFERFYQKNETQKGVGIGLALVKELVDLYKGKIETKLDHTTLSFVIELPLDSIATNAVLIDKKEPQNNTFEEVWVENELPSLLIVDDNQDIRLVLRDLFKNNYQIIEATDGEQALEIALREIPDCIISDVMMPKMDGFEFTKAIKTNELTSFIPIILLTAKTSDEAHLQGLKSTADAYLTKPFNNDIVRETVLQILNERKKLHDRYSHELILKPTDIVINSVDEKFLEKLQLVLDKELTNADFSADDFASFMGVSRMQLHRKLKSLLGVSTTEFLRKERLKMAAALIKKGGVNISEIAYAVGFNDISYFNRCFKEQFDCTPKDFINKSS
ncbi:MAG: response regulator [Flavobacterium sp.]|nr:response regulator [Flavobacterium sp.]